MERKKILAAWGLACLALLVADRTPAASRSYDPLAVSAQPRQAPLDLTVRDEERRREIPLRIYLPAATAPAAAVLFSHGLGGSREGNAYLGTHWASRGYVAVFLQHPGSDKSVWRDKPRDSVWPRCGRRRDWRISCCG